MVHRLRSYLLQHHIGLLALFVALSGTAYAAAELPPNSVGARQLKRSAVVSSRVKDFSLLRRDFKRGQLPRGPVGPPGAAGTARAYGVASAAGQFDPARSRNVLSVNRIAAGVYCVSVTPPATRPPTPLEPTTILAMIGAEATPGATIRTSASAAGFGCPALSNVFAVLTGTLRAGSAGTVTETPTDQPFSFVVP